MVHVRQSSSTLCPEDYTNVGFFNIGEAVGYMGRVLNALEDEGCWNIGPYVVQNTLILLGPAFMAASIYMILGRVILLTAGEHHALVKRKWLTKTLFGVMWYRSAHSQLVSNRSLYSICLHIMDEC